MGVHTADVEVNTSSTRAAARHTTPLGNATGQGTQTNRRGAQGRDGAAVEPHVSPVGYSVDQPFVLATDLDGTFLGGDESARAELYTLLRTESSHTLIFATGRGLESVLPLLADSRVPTPAYVIADVGCTVVRGDTLEPVHEVQTDIQAAWPGTLRILDALREVPGLIRQDVPQERRASYYLEDVARIPEIQQIVAPFDCRVLHSAGRYLDVLPRGVDKGSTLRRLLALLGVDERFVVVAGDTANDLALFDAGYRGIAVGNADDQVRAHVEGNAQVYVASGHGAAGILEGLEGFGWVSRTDVEASPRPSFGPSNLVMVYHRMPPAARAASEAGGKSVSPNGILPTLLDFFADGTQGAWIAASDKAASPPAKGVAPAKGSASPADRSPEFIDPERYPNLTLSRVPLTRDDIHLFYERFSKEAFWPVIFSFPSKAVFVEDHFERYKKVNERFAERAADVAAYGATVWVHDYNLWLVPGLLRQRRPDLRIAFFHHTAFPPGDVFNIVPWRREILSSLLCCDYVGFHIPKYVENFVDCVRSHAPVVVTETEACAPRFMTYGCAMGTDRVSTCIEVQGARVHLGVHPVGIDVDKIGATLARTDVREKAEELRREVGDRTCILSIERLDYVKGPLEKLRAFERLLEEHPEFRGRVVLFSICTPPAPGMRVYGQTRSKVDEAVGRINGRFAELSWTPVRYFYRALDPDTVIAHYAAADVAWITPLRDGLNLVAKEFVATRHLLQREGVLVLSEFAGAAAELHGALLTNPYDPSDLKHTLHQALCLHPEQRRAQMERLGAIVQAHDVQDWGRSFLEAVARTGEA